MALEKICTVVIDEYSYQFKVKGKFFKGKDVVLYNQSKENILKDCNWEENGFKKISLFNKNEFTNLEKSVRTQVIKALQKADVKFDEDNFKLENYHKTIQTEEEHLAVINYTRNLTNEDLDIDIEKIASKCAEHINYNLSTHIKDLGGSYIIIRIVRPNTLDINPPHRDGYLDFYKNILNIWIPISGCNKGSSLPLIPKSHFVPENKIIRTEAKGAEINGNLYTVPCMLETINGPFHMTRPNPKQKEALIFTPFLIHGAAINTNKDITRISLELRFEKKD